MGQSHQVTIVLKLRSNNDNNITRERGILTRLIQIIVEPQREEYNIKTEGIKRRDGRSHHIHQVQWRI